MVSGVARNKSEAVRKTKGSIIYLSGIILVLYPSATRDVAFTRHVTYAIIAIAPQS